jgi:hypothetical protein
MVFYRQTLFLIMLSFFRWKPNLCGIRVVIYTLFECFGSEEEVLLGIVEKKFHGEDPFTLNGTRRKKVPRGYRVAGKIRSGGQVIRVR